MGYYDEDGHYHSFRSNLPKRDPRIDSVRDTGLNRSDISEVPSPKAVTIPCHHIRLGDFLILQDRPCQAIRISTSSTTGQYRVLGVDLFTKQLYEEASFISNPAPGVTVQALLGPVFTQYLVHDIQKGQITVVTERGDKKEGIGILEQSDLRDRLKSSLETSNVSIRVLVINDNGRDLAVDMRVIHDQSPADETTGEAEHAELFRAAVRTNDPSEVNKALEEGSDIINTRDSEGRTALFDAIECHHKDMVDHLLKHGIDIGVLDKSGKTVLDIAVAQPKLYEITFSLLEQGALSIADSNNDVSHLLSATAAGEYDKVVSLLNGGLNPNTNDRLGYTALHEAARFGHYETARTLIRRGAKINSEITHGGTSVLQAVVQRGREHRDFFEKDRKIVPHLSESHLQVVALLLQNGVDTEHRRSCDNLTMRDLVSQELMAPQLEIQEGCRTTERRYLQMILVILNRPTPEEGEALTVPLHERWHEGDWITGLLDSFQLQISYHTSSRKVKQTQASVQKFLYGKVGEASGVHPIQELDKWLKNSEESSSEPMDYWRWVHLPSNNKLWVEDLIRSLSGMESIALNAYWRGIRSFINGSFHEKKGSQVYFREPSFTPLFGSHSGIFSLVMPYLDSESLSCLLKTEVCPNEECKRSFDRNEVLEKHYSKFGHGTACFHLPCTLDQSWYLALQHSGERDKDQVVVKHAKRQEELEQKRHGVSATQVAKPKKLLMVNQMWIWKIDATTLITTFPDRRHPGQPGLLAQISKTMQERPPATVGSMVSRLLKFTTGFLDAPTNSGLDENLFHVFEQGIAYRSQKDAESYSLFYKLQQGLRKLGQKAGPDDQNLCLDKVRKYIENEICDISNEVEHLREIKDIKDELSMIQRVFESQRTVVARYLAGQTELEADLGEGQPEFERSSLPDVERHELLDTRKDLDTRISKVKFLLTDATSVEESLNHLLDLKQKQGNLIVVRDTRSLADDADKRAKSSALQSQLLFIFTVVTVVFTPISFTSTFLAVPTREFPHDSGQEVAWGWWQVFIAGMVAEILTFLLVGLWLFQEGSVLPLNMRFKTWTRQKHQKDELSKV